MKINESKIKWINFLHIYQPANADDNKICEATKKSYLRIIRGLEEHPYVNFTLNITGCLVLRWIETGNEDIIKRIKKLIKKGQIELTGSAAYHPLLPLVDKKEVEKQIKENEEILLKHFGWIPPGKQKEESPSSLKLRRGKGFFFPEMAYGAKVAKIVKRMGYEWIILDEISRNGKLKRVDVSRRFLHTPPFGHPSQEGNFNLPFGQGIVVDKNSGLKVIFRSREFSNCYVPETLNKLKTSDEVIITGTDGELIGLRHEDPTAEFERVLRKKNLETLTISEFIDNHKNLKKEKIVNSNWESTEKDLRRRRPYALWENSGNGIQKRIWKLAKLAYKTTEGNQQDNNYIWARWHLVRGLASCTFWWASGRDFSYIYGPYAWNPDEIERGIRELIKSIRSIDDRATRRTKINAERLYVRIKQMIWEKHWGEHWKR